MKLTGKCKEDFEKWFTDNDNHKGFDSEQIALDREYRLKILYQLTGSMQYGIYVDFFDSVGVYITEIPNWKNGIRTFRIGYHIEFGGVVDSVFIRPEKNSPFFVEFSTRNEARTEAIKNANEIYNR